VRRRPSDEEREQAIRAIMRDGYDRHYAEMAYDAEDAEAHGEPLGCTVSGDTSTIAGLIATYGEEVAAQILQHPMERARFGLPPLAEPQPTTARG